MNTDQSFYVLRHLNGKYVEQDRPSGGYPYLVDRLHQAYAFETFEEAFRYKGVFSKNQFESDSWRIVRCDVTQTIISMKRFALSHDRQSVFGRYGETDV